MQQIGTPAVAQRRHLVIRNVMCNCCVSVDKTKLTKTPILVIQGRSRPSMLVPMESSSAVLVMIGSKSVSIYIVDSTTILVLD